MTEDEYKNLITNIQYGNGERIETSGYFVNSNIETTDIFSDLTEGAIANSSETPKEKFNLESIFPPQKFSFFEQVDYLDFGRSFEEAEEEINLGYDEGQIRPGLVLGIEWCLDGCSSSKRPDFNNGHWEYIIYNEANYTGEIMRSLSPEEESRVRPQKSTSKDFEYIPRPIYPPTFKIGDSFYDPENWCHIVIMSIEWGRLDSCGEEDLTPGWNYLAYWVRDPWEKSEDDPIGWDADSGYAEEDLIEYMENCKKMTNNP